MTIGTLGVIAAGTIAGIAVYNVAAQSTTAVPPSAQMLQVTPSPALPAPITGELPALPEVGTPTTTPTTTPATSQEVSVADVAGISRTSATAAVLAAAPGSPIKATAVNKDGYRSWAVQVRRADGSVVTAYVDRGTGVIFAWNLDKAAPTSAGAGGYQDDDSMESEYEGDKGEDESGEGKASEAEHEDDYEDGDDD